MPFSLFPQNLSVLVHRIVSYELFRLNVNLFRGIREGSVELLVCDEAHRLKGSGSQTLTALESLSTNARLCITATPIQNNLAEFFHVANFVSPGVLGELNRFRREFDRPISMANSRSASLEQKRKAKQQSEVLDQIIKAFMLRRLASDVLIEMLPPRSEILVFTPPSTMQCKVYRKISRGATESISTETLTALTQLRKACIHPDLVDEDELEKDPDLQLSGKLSILKSLLLSIRAEAPDEKVVVVSNFTTALSLIEKLVLKPNNWNYVRLDGSTDVKNRQALVDSFNVTSAERSFCFLLSAKAGGCGLNLVGANRLILVDPDWNPATGKLLTMRAFFPNSRVCLLTAVLCHFHLHFMKKISRLWGASIDKVKPSPPRYTDSFCRAPWKR